MNMENAIESQLKCTKEFPCSVGKTSAFEFEPFLLENDFYNWN